MSFKNIIVITTIIIMLSTLMTKINSANLRIEGKYRGKSSEANVLNYHSLLATRHNHLFRKKHYKCNVERFDNGRHSLHLMKQSRYPTLDKIVSRLDNRIDRGFIKMKAITTTTTTTTTTTLNPFDSWDFAVTDPVTDKRSKYTYVTVGLRNQTKTTAQHRSKKVQTGRFNQSQSGWTKEEAEGEDDDEGEDMKIKSGEYNEDDDSYNSLTSGGIGGDLVREITTPGPWDNEQRDVSSHGEKNSTYSQTSTPLVFESSSYKERKGEEDKKEKKTDEILSSSWSLGRLVSKITEVDERKKKTTPMPYVAAHEHYEQVLRNADCHVPKEKIIKVHEVHPDPSKSYSPSCTILHQCSDDTGCCKDLKQVCKPKNTTKVELYFFTTTLGKAQTVEKLFFVNHTECECQRRTDESLMPRDSEFRRAAHLKKFFGINSREKKRRNSCTCPNKYSPRNFINDTCICDCFDKEEDCLLLKRGKVHFPHQDRLCIQREICGKPSCEFGTYLRESGRCPSRKTNNHQHDHNHNHNHHHHHDHQQQQQHGLSGWSKYFDSHDFQGYGFSKS